AEPREGARRPGKAGRRRRLGSSVRLRPAADAGAVSVPASPALARRPGKRRAAWRRRRLVLLLMSPWIVGFTVFFGYPLVMSVYLSFTLRPAFVSALDRALELPLPARHRPADLARRLQHALDDRRGGAPSGGLRDW